jgi:hypothetical protein
MLFTWNSSFCKGSTGVLLYNIHGILVTRRTSRLPIYCIALPSDNEFSNIYLPFLQPCWVYLLCPMYNTAEATRKVERILMPSLWDHVLRTGNFWRKHPPCTRYLRQLLLWSSGVWRRIVCCMEMTRSYMSDVRNLNILRRENVKSRATAKFCLKSVQPLRKRSHTRLYIWFHWAGKEENTNVTLFLCVVRVRQTWHVARIRPEMHIQ